MSLVVRRLSRLARRRSLHWTVHALRREVRLRRDEAQLRRVLRSQRTLIVGPFLGEVGYELLYWRPLVLRLLRSHGVDPERVVVVSRGGAGAWYGEFAARAIDVFELISPDELRRGVDERAQRTGQRKQMEEDDLDAFLIRELRARVGDADVLHPRLMYGRLRFLWEGLRPPADALQLGDYDDLPRQRLSPELESRLPERFAALKLYFNVCLPDRPDVHAEVATLVRDLDLPVVALEAGASVDDHEDWRAAGVDVVHVGDLLDPSANLPAQAEIAARAELLLATYGGFSYVGPFVGTPTEALWVEPEKNERHERILRAVRPNASYERTRLGSASISLT